MQKIPIQAITCILVNIKQISEGHVIVVQGRSSFNLRNHYIV